MLIVAILLFTGFFFISRIDASKPGQSLIFLYVFYGVLCGTGVGIGYITAISSVVPWFPGRAGLASGVLLMCFGLGGMALGSVVNNVISSAGLHQIFLILAIANAVVIAVGSNFVKLPPAVHPNASAVLTGRDFTTVQMIKDPTFIIYFIWSVAMGSAGLLIVNSAAVIAAAFGAPAVLGLIVSVFNGSSRLVFGQILDRYGRKTSMLISCSLLLTAGISLYFGAITHNAVLIIIGIMATGTCYGSGPTTSSVIMNKIYGPKHYAVNYSITIFTLMPSAFIGPMISSALIDMSDGAYNYSFIMIIILALLSFFLWAAMNKAAVKANHE